MKPSAICGRDLYHAVRRGTVRTFPPSEYHPYFRACREDRVVPVRACAKQAARRLLGVPALPKGMTALVESVASAVRCSRQPVVRRALQERFQDFLADRVLAEAGRRGLPTVLGLANNGYENLAFHSMTRTLEGRLVVLVSAAGYAEYSTAFGSRRASLSILGGWDDNGMWAVRVPGSIVGVAEALAWLKPAEVRKAEEQGRRVLRQGDVWIVERGRDAMARADLPPGHRWDARQRMLRHGDHAPTRVDFPAIAVTKSALAASGPGRRRGD